MHLDRRLLLQFGAFGAGALAIPGAAAAIAARGFTHSVASGEPSQSSVLLWTRFVPRSGGSARLNWQLSDSSDFGRIIRQGEAVARADNDHCVKPVAEGLEPGRWYFYRFRAADGTLSPTGRTRTLPEGPVGQFNIALFSCSNIGFGWFNAYAHAAERRDIDLVVHVGDYLYEYERGRYPSSAQALRVAAIEPVGEMIRLADYRLRFAAYRSDPDLQRLHQLFPMVAMWDDHESANDSWVDGAENHQPDSEGLWTDRKSAASQVYREWMPVGDEPWASYDIGELATLFRPETRLTGRSRQHRLSELLPGEADVTAALTRFRDGPWQDPARGLMGPGQERWLADGMRQSVARGAKWQLLAQQVIMGTMAMPPESGGWDKPDASPETRARTAQRLAAANVGLPFNFDAWDGYPAQRDRLLKAALEADANLIVLSGDTHNAWAFELDSGGTPAGVEIGGQSVTSPGFGDSYSNVPVTELERAMRARNPQLKWTDLGRRGYATVEMTPDRVISEWNFLDTIKRRSTRMAGNQRMTVTRGQRRFS